MSSLSSGIMGILFGALFFFIIQWLIRLYGKSYAPYKNDLSWETITQIESALTQVTDFHEGLLYLHETLKNLFEVDSFYVAFYDPNESRIFFPILVNVGKIKLYPFSEMPRVSVELGKGFTNHIIKTNQTLYLPDTVDLPPTFPPSTRLGGTPTRTYLGVPLRLADEAIGVISIQSNRVGVYTRSTILFMERLAKHVSYMVQNFKLLEGLQQNILELESIQQSSASILSSLERNKIIDAILDELEKIVPNDCAQIVWYQDNEPQLFSRKDTNYCTYANFKELGEAEKDILNKVLETQQTLYINAPLYEQRPFWEEDTQVHIAYMGVPLIVHEQLNGVLILSKNYVKDKVWGFTNHHVNLANAMADHISLALNNAVVYDELRKQEEKVKESELIYRTVYELANDGICVIDQGMFTYTNAQLANILGYEPEEIENTLFTNYLFGECIARIAHDYQQAMAGIQMPPRFDGQVIRKDGTILDVEFSASALDYPPNPRVVVITRDVTEKRNLEKELREWANTDPLIKIPNRRYFLQLAGKEVNQTIQHQLTISFILFDLDHFKKVNDVHGHLVGDEILKQVAVLCNQNIRSSDLICRYGGEEFLIMLPGTEQAAAMDKAEKLRIALEDHHFETKTGVLHITASFGVSSSTPEKSDLMVLIDEADQALYQGKQKGRNQVSTLS